MNSFDDIFENAAPKREFDDRPFDTEAWAEKKQAERQAVYALADDTAYTVAGDGSQMKAYLDVQTRFDRYSATNALLILAQMPQATQVKDFDGWKAEGVTIKRQQKSFSILEPGNEYTREDGSIGTSYNVKKVFDISQTTARAKSRPAVDLDDRLLLKALIHRSPVPIQMADELPNNTGALYDHEQQTIFVRRGLEAHDLFRCVSMALSRAEIAANGQAYDPAQAAFPAYCASYMLCKKHGIDVSGYDFSSLPEDLSTADAQGIRKVLTEIRDTAHDISARMSRVLEQSKAPRTQEQER